MTENNNTVNIENHSIEQLGLARSGDSIIIYYPEKDSENNTGVEKQVVSNFFEGVPLPNSDGSLDTSHSVRSEDAWLNINGKKYYAYDLAQYLTQPVAIHNESSAEVDVLFVGDNGRIALYPNETLVLKDQDAYQRFEKNYVIALQPNDQREINPDYLPSDLESNSNQYYMFNMSVDKIREDNNLVLEISDKKSLTLMDFFEDEESDSNYNDDALPPKVILSGIDNIVITQEKLESSYIEDNHSGAGDLELLQLFKNNPELQESILELEEEAFGLDEENDNENSNVTVNIPETQDDSVPPQVEEAEAPSLLGWDTTLALFENSSNITPQFMDASVTLVDPDTSMFDNGYLIVSYLSGAQLGDQLSIASIGTGWNEIGVSGNQVSYSGVTFATLSGGSNGTSLVVNFEEDANTEAVEALIEHIQFQHTSDAPATTKLLSLTMSDGQGGVGTLGNINISITPENDAPLFLNLENNITVAENLINLNAQKLDTNVTFTDPDLNDYNNGYLLVDINSGGTIDDFLAIDLGGSVNVIGNDVYFGANIIGTIDAINDGLNGNALEIHFNSNSNASIVDSVIESITYQNLSDTPIASRQIDLSIFDGDGGLAADSIIFDITAENDAPTLNNLRSSFTINENDPAVFIDANVSLTDPDSPDFNLGVLTVAMNGANDPTETLGIDVTGTVTVVGNVVSVAGINIGTIDAVNDGTAGKDLQVTFNTNATPARVDTLIESLTYRSQNLAPQLSRQIDVTVSDGDSGSANQSVSVNIIPFYSPPVISNFSASIGFVEDSVAPIILDSAINLTDIDSPDFNTGNIEISINGGGTAEETLAVDLSGVVSIAGNVVSVSGVAIGTIDAVKDGSTGNNLLINFNSNTTLANVELLIEALNYHHGGDNPPAARIIDIDINDGDGGSSSDSITVNITAINDEPNINNLNAAVNFIEDQIPAILIDNAVSVVDPDSADFNTGVLTVAMNGTLDTTETLAIDTSGTVAIIGSDVQVGGVSIGTIDAVNNGTLGRDLIVTFNANSTPANIEALV